MLEVIAILPFRQATALMRRSGCSTLAKLTMRGSQTGSQRPQPSGHPRRNATGHRAFLQPGRGRPSGPPAARGKLGFRFPIRVDGKEET
jgi:hypothetical protein